MNMAHLNYDYYYNVPEPKGSGTNNMTGSSPNNKTESNKYSSSLNNSIYSAYMPPPSFGPYSTSPAPYMASAAVSDPFSIMNMSSASSALYVDHASLFNNKNRQTLENGRAPSKEPPKPHLKNYYDHRYSSYEPMYDYFNYSNSTTQNQSSISPSVLSNGDKTSSTTPVNRRPIKIKNLTATPTTTTSSDDSEFKAFKEKYNLTGNDQSRLNNRHSINIDNLTYQTKDVPSMVDRKLSKDKERLASNQLNGIKNNGLDEFESKSEADTKARLKQISARNTTKTPTVLMSDPITNSAKLTSTSENSSSGVGSGSKESPLFQKIMAKLAELPDSVLIKNYKSGSQAASNENKGGASNLKNTSSKTNDQSPSSSKTITTKSNPLSSASTPKSSVEKTAGSGVTERKPENRNARAIKAASVYITPSALSSTPMIPKIPLNDTSRPSQTDKSTGKSSNSKPDQAKVAASTSPLKANFKSELSLPTMAYEASLIDSYVNNESSKPKKQQSVESDNNKKTNQTKPNTVAPELVLDDLIYSDPKQHRSSQQKKPPSSRPANTNDVQKVTSVKSKQDTTSGKDKVVEHKSESSSGGAQTASPIVSNNPVVTARSINSAAPTSATTNSSKSSAITSPNKNKVENSHKEISNKDERPKEKLKTTPDKNLIAVKTNTSDSKAKLVASVPASVSNQVQIGENRTDHRLIIEATIKPIKSSTPPPTSRKLQIDPASALIVDSVKPNPTKSNRDTSLKSTETKSKQQKTNDQPSSAAKSAPGIHEVDMEEIEQSTNFDQSSSFSSSDSEDQTTAFILLNKLNRLKTKNSKTPIPIEDETGTAKIISNYPRVLTEKLREKPSTACKSITIESKSEQSEQTKKPSVKKSPLTTLDENNHTSSGGSLEPQQSRIKRQSISSKQTKTEHSTKELEEIENQSRKQKNQQTSSTSPTTNMRLIQTPPPPPPTSLPIGSVDQSTSKSKKTDSSTKENSNKDSGGSLTCTTNNASLSITSSIREGKLEKPIRSNHALPPPPPPPPHVLSNRHSVVGSGGVILRPATVTPTSGLDSCQKKATSPTVKAKHAIIEDLPAPTPHRGFTPTFQVVDTPSKQSSRSSGSKNRDTSAHKSHTKQQESASPPVPVYNNTPPPAVTKTRREDKQHPTMTTNLPQLDKIDYIFKTNDEKYFTSGVPISEDKKPAKSKPSRSSDNRQHRSQKSSNSCGVKQQQSSSSNQQPRTPDFPNYYDEPSFPWDIRDSKNFYEVYSKENDRRKREGNSFLMLLPGIAIPIDTDADQSDDAGSSGAGSSR